MATALQLEQLAEFEEAERYADEARRLAKPPRAVHIDQLRGAQHPAPFGLLFENRDGLIYIRPEATR